MYDALSLNDSDLITVFSQFVSDDKDKAASASFGGCTSLEEVGGELPTYDGIFATAMAQGQTVFASSGDTGTACEGVSNGVPAGVPGTEYPASSEYVVGVGGTSLFTTAANLYQGEIPWAGAGGGVEPFETEGAWASTVATTSTGSGLRSVPDISMDADPNISGADVTVSGATEIIGGTSLASPMALAVWARILSNTSETLGNAAPLFYKEFGDDEGTLYVGRPGDLTSTVGGFNDLQIGTNVGYPATPGYDLASGIGSLDIALQIQDIKN
jgi:subtilase family serine protease